MFWRDRIKDAIKSKLSLRPPVDPYIKTLTRKLRERIEALPPLQTNRPQSEWDLNRMELRKQCFEGDPRFFTKWDVIRRTMFVGNSSYVCQELEELRYSVDWSSRWKRVLIEDAIGAPERSRYYMASSGNRIHHAYSLFNFERRTGTRINDLQCIVEFGGGYGSLCRLAYKLGFKGRYIIFDFPEFLALQEYYLNSLGIPFAITASAQDDNYVYGISNIENFHQLITSIKSGCLIALWSLSESPIFLRNEIMSTLSGFSYHLIALQRTFEGIDNISFAKSLMDQRCNLHWDFQEIPHLPGNYYLISCTGR